MDKLRSQRGQGLILALIVVAFSAAVISFAYLSSTTLLGVRYGEQRALDLYASDAGVEHALWRLRYESGFAGSLASPASYTETFNSRNTSITVTSVNASLPSTCILAPPESGGHLAICTMVSPRYVTPNQLTTFTYRMSIENHGTSRVHLYDLGDLLPPGFAYVTDSASSTGILRSPGPILLGLPTITIVSGRQQVVWSFDPPRPYVESGTTATVTFQATATLSEGTYNDDAWVTDADWVSGVPTSIGDVTPYTPIVAAWPEFDITSAAGALAVKARAKLPDTGIVILSWQVD